MKDRKPLKSEEVMAWSEYFQGFDQAVSMCDDNEVRDIEEELRISKEALDKITRADCLDNAQDLAYEALSEIEDV